MGFKQRIKATEAFISAMAELSDEGENSLGVGDGFIRGEKEELSTLRERELLFQEKEQDKLARTYILAQKSEIKAMASVVAAHFAAQRDEQAIYPNRSQYLEMSDHSRVVGIRAKGEIITKISWLQKIPAMEKSTALIKALIKMLRINGVSDGFSHSSIPGSWISIRIGDIGTFI